MKKSKILMCCLTAGNGGRGRGIPRLPENNIFKAHVEDKTLYFLDEKVKLPPALAKIPSFKGDFILPLKSMVLNDKGDFKAKILSVEAIEEFYVAEALFDKEHIFVYVNKNVKAGDEIHFDIKMNEISLTDGDKNYVEQIGETDGFRARYLNYKSVMDRNDNKEFEKDHDARVSFVEEKYKNVFVNEDNEFNKKLEAAKNVDVAPIKAENKEKLVKAKETLIKELKEYHEVYKENDQKQAKNHKDSLAKVTQEINKIYDARRKDEDDSYKEFLRINKDAEAKSKRREEHLSFNENFGKEKENDLNLKISSVNLENDTLVGANKAQYKRNKNLAKQNYKEIKDNCYAKEHCVEVCKKEHKANLKKLEVQKAQEIKKAGLLYFFNVNGFYIESNDIISEKLNQGLGTKLFTKEFLLEFPHDAYKISEKGLKVKVEENLDYGKFILLKCSYIDVLKDKHYLYVNSDKKYKENNEINIGFDIARSSIIETGMDIRLY